MKNLMVPFIFLSYKKQYIVLRLHLWVTTGLERSISKGLNENLLVHLLRIYNHIWRSVNIPRSWMSATILLILKPGKQRKEITSYYPITLTSVSCKIVERIGWKYKTIKS